MGIETLNIPFKGEYIKQGDTIAKTVIEFSDSINLEAENVSIKMQLYLGLKKVIDLSVGNGITITGEKTFEIDEVSAENNNLPSGCILGDLEITDTNGVRLTYFNVQYNIIKQYTK